MELTTIHACRLVLFRAKKRMSINDTMFIQSGFFESIAEFVRDNVWELD